MEVQDVRIRTSSTLWKLKESEFCLSVIDHNQVLCLCCPERNKLRRAILKESLRPSNEGQPGVKINVQPRWMCRRSFQSEIKMPLHVALGTLFCNKVPMQDFSRIVSVRQSWTSVEPPVPCTASQIS